MRKAAEPFKLLLVFCIQNIEKSYILKILAGTQINRYIFQHPVEKHPKPYKTNGIRLLQIHSDRSPVQIHVFSGQTFRYLCEVICPAEFFLFFIFYLTKRRAFSGTQIDFQKIFVHPVTVEEIGRKIINDLYLF